MKLSGYSWSGFGGWMLNSELHTKRSCLGQESNNPLNHVIKLKKKTNVVKCLKDKDYKEEQKAHSEGSASLSEGRRNRAQCQVLSFWKGSPKWNNQEATLACTVAGMGQFSRDVRETPSDMALNAAVVSMAIHSPVSPFPLDNEFLMSWRDKYAFLCRHNQTNRNEWSRCFIWYSF